MYLLTPLLSQDKSAHLPAAVFVFFSPATPPAPPREHMDERQAEKHLTCANKHFSYSSVEMCHFGKWV